jgi:hypothetical protein
MKRLMLTLLTSMVLFGPYAHADLCNSVQDGSTTTETKKDVEALTMNTGAKKRWLR